MKFFIPLLLLTFTLVPSAQAQTEAPNQTLFTNVNVWDGTSKKLAMGQDVLVEGNLIKKIGKSLATPGTDVIDGGGRTLLPGFIDNHVHLVLTGANLSAIEAMDWGQIAYAFVSRRTRRSCGFCILFLAT